MSPFRPPPSACSPPVWVAQSPRDLAIRSIEAWTSLLEADALAGAGGLRLGDQKVGLVVLSQLDHLACQGLEPLAKRLLAGLLSSAQVPERAHDRPLEVGQGIGAILGRELLQQGRALLVQRTAHELRDLLLDGSIAAAIEVVRDPLGQLLVAGLQRPGQPLAQFGRMALELRANVVHLGGHVLTVQHPRSDLDRVSHGPRGLLPGLRSLAHHPRGSLVGDR